MLRDLLLTNNLRRLRIDQSLKNRHVGPARKLKLLEKIEQQPETGQLHGLFSRFPGLIHTSLVTSSWTSGSQTLAQKSLGFGASSGYAQILEGQTLPGKTALSVHKLNSMQLTLLQPSAKLPKLRLHFIANGTEWTLAWLACCWPPPWARSCSEHENSHLYF